MKIATAVSIIFVMCVAVSDTEAEPKAKTSSPKASNVDVDRKGNPILRRSFGFDAKYSFVTINKRQMQKGLAFSFEGDTRFGILKAMELRFAFDFSFDKLQHVEKDALEKKTLFNLTLELRTPVLTARRAKLYMGFGARYHMENNDLNLEATKGNANFHLGGPMLSIALESRYFDIFLDGALLVGAKRTSYDRDRELYMLYTSVKLVPRFWRFSMPIAVSAYIYDKMELVKDRTNVRVRTNVKLAFSVSRRFDLFLSFNYLFHTGTDDYQIFKTGLGVRGRF